MKPSEQCYELIKQFEGLSLRAYKALPTEKYYTIGYGHYSKDIKKGQLITQQQAEKFLHDDVEEFATLLDKDCPHLKQHQYDALISFIYNIGWYRFRYSTIRNLVHDGAAIYTTLSVARRITHWVRAGGKVLLGLQKRRVIEANHFLGYEKFQLKDNQIIELDTTEMRNGK